MEQECLPVERLDSEFVNGRADHDNLSLSDQSGDLITNTAKSEVNMSSNMDETESNNISTHKKKRKRVKHTSNTDLDLTLQLSNNTQLNELKPQDDEFHSASDENSNFQTGNVEIAEHFLLGNVVQFDPELTAEADKNEEIFTHSSLTVNKNIESKVPNHIDPVNESLKQSVECEKSAFRDNTNSFESKSVVKRACENVSVPNNTLPDHLPNPEEISFDIRPNSNNTRMSSDDQNEIVDSASLKINPANSEIIMKENSGEKSNGNVTREPTVESVVARDSVENTETVQASQDTANVTKVEESGKTVEKQTNHAISDEKVENQIDKQTVGTDEEQISQLKTLSQTEFPVMTEPENDSQVTKHSDIETIKDKITTHTKGYERNDAQSSNIDEIIENGSLHVGQFVMDQSSRWCPAYIVISKSQIRASFADRGSNFNSQGSMNMLQIPLGHITSTDPGEELNDSLYGEIFTVVVSTLSSRFTIGFSSSYKRDEHITYVNKLKQNLDRNRHNGCARFLHFMFFPCKRIFKPSQNSHNFKQCVGKKSSRDSPLDKPRNLEADSAPSSPYS